MKDLKKVHKFQKFDCVNWKKLEEQFDLLKMKLGHLKTKLDRLKMKEFVL